MDKYAEDLQALGLKAGGAFSDDEDIEEDPTVINAGGYTTDLCKHCTKASDHCACLPNMPCGQPIAQSSPAQTALYDSAHTGDRVGTTSSEGWRRSANATILQQPSTISLTGSSEIEIPITKPLHQLTQPTHPPSQPIQHPRYLEYMRLLSAKTSVEMSPRILLIELKTAGMACRVEEIEQFWSSHAAMISLLVENNSTALVLEFLSIVRDSRVYASYYLRGIAGGMSIKTETRYKDMLDEISSSAATMKILLQDSITASSAHMNQTREFAAQMTSASKSVADFKVAVESVKLLGVKMDVTPPGAPVHTPSYPSTSHPVFIDPHPGVQASEFRIPKLSGNGHFISKFGTVVINNGVIGTMGFESKGLSALTELVGMKSSIAELILNRNLEVLEAYGGKNPDWLKGFKDGSDQRRISVIEIVTKIPVLEGQWVKRTMI